MWKRRYRRRLKWVVLIGILLIMTSAVLLAGKRAKVLESPIVKTQEKMQWDNNPLDVNGYTKVKVGVTPERMYLVNECNALVMATSRGKAYTVQRGLEGTYEEMPDTFDSTYDLLENYGIKIKMVKVEELDDQIYKAKVIAERGNELLGIEVKPSDALAFGVRFGAPVYVQTDLLEKYGQKVC